MSRARRAIGHGERPRTCPNGHSDPHASLKRSVARQELTAVLHFGACFRPSPMRFQSRLTHRPSA